MSGRTRHRCGVCIAGAVAGLCLSAARPVPAQEPAPSGANAGEAGVGSVSTPADSLLDASQPRRRCAGETITEIVVRPRAPFVRGMLDRWQLIARAVDELHVTTKPELVRRFLLLAPGDECTELRRAESERILRAQPFLATAVVRPEPDGEGRVRLVVETVDEVTIVGGLRATAGSPRVRMLRVGEGNLLGQGVAVSAEWRAGRFGRDGFTARATDYQLLGRPYQLALEGRRDELGGGWQAALTHPFFTDLQRVAWLVRGGSTHDFYGLRQIGADEMIVGVSHDFADVGGIMRVGPPGRLSLFGISVSAESERVDPTVQRFTPEGYVTVSDSFAILPRYRPVRSARLNALWGVRSISFLPVIGFDALTAIQDVREGFQAGALVGRSLSILGSRDDDLFLAGDLYGGIGSPNSFVMVQARGEARQDFDSNRWDDVLGSATATWYLHLGEGHTMVTRAEWAGGWRMRNPFQLLLGEPRGGVRGYDRSPAGGAQRAVLRVENRWYLGQYKETGEYGLAGFVDAGRLWAGDAPFGVRTAPKIGVGVGLLAALPAGSQRLWRVDVAYPVSPDPRARLELRLSSSNASLFGYRESRDVARSRQRTVPEGIYSWP